MMCRCRRETCCAHSRSLAAGIDHHQIKNHIARGHICGAGLRTCEHHIRLAFGMGSDRIIEEILPEGIRIVHTQHRIGQTRGDIHLSLASLKHIDRGLTLKTRLVKAAFRHRTVACGQRIYAHVEAALGVEILKSRPGQDLVGIHISQRNCEIRRIGSHKLRRARTQHRDGILHIGRGR